jgi:hypothetical protein
MTMTQSSTPALSAVSDVSLLPLLEALSPQASGHPLMDLQDTLRRLRGTLDVLTEYAIANQGDNDIDNNIVHVLMTAGSVAGCAIDQATMVEVRMITVGRQLKELAQRVGDKVLS